MLLAPALSASRRPSDLYRPGPSPDLGPTASVYLEFKSRPISPSTSSRPIFSGQGNYGPNLVATNATSGNGIVLETVDTNGLRHRNHPPLPRRLPIRYCNKTPPDLRVRISGLQDQVNQPLATSTWTLSLLPNRRNFTLASRTIIPQTLPLKAVQIGIHLNQWFMNGFFQRGVVQYVNSGDQLFSTTNRLHTFYTMDNTQGSVAVVPRPSPAPAFGWAMVSEGDHHGVGLNLILAGQYPAAEHWSPPDWASPH